MPSSEPNEAGMLPRSRPKTTKSSTLDCPVCQKPYSRRDVLKRHMVSQHEQKRCPRPPRRSKRKSCLRCALYRVRCTGPPACTQCDEKKVVCQFDFASVIESGPSYPTNVNVSSCRSPSTPIQLKERIDTDFETQILYHPEPVSSPETCSSEGHRQNDSPKLFAPRIEEARITPSTVDLNRYLDYDTQFEIGELPNSGHLFIQDIPQDSTDVYPSVEAPLEQMAMLGNKMVPGYEQPEQMNILEYAFDQTDHPSLETLNSQFSSASNGNEQQPELSADEGQRNFDIAFVRLFHSSGRFAAAECPAFDRSLEFASNLPISGEEDLKEYWISYFTSFHKTLPVIHMASMEFDPSPSLLLATITAIGADYLVDSEAQRYASATYEKLFGFLAAPMDCLRAECSKCLLLLAAKCLICYRILDHRNLLFFNTALGLMSHLTVEALRLGLFAVQDINLMPQEEFSIGEYSPMPYSPKATLRNATELITRVVSKDEVPKWRKWVSNEQQKRLGWAVFAADHLSSLLTNSPSQILETDLKISSPCLDAFWDAQNAREWRSLFPWTPSPPTPLPFAGVIRNVILGEFPLKKLSDFNLDLCIFVFEMAVLGLGGSHIMGMHPSQLKSLPVRTKLLEVLALLKNQKHNGFARL